MTRFGMPEGMPGYEHRLKRMYRLYIAQHGRASCDFAQDKLSFGKRTSASLG
jgi:hypothetical protein